LNRISRDLPSESLRISRRPPDTGLVSFIKFTPPVKTTETFNGWVKRCVSMKTKSPVLPPLAVPAPEGETGAQPMYRVPTRQLTQAGDHSVAGNQTQPWRGSLIHDP
jgi:hypothetical protein